MQRKHRLTGAKRFSQIHQESRGIANRLLVIRFLPNGLDESRFAFLVNKRIGNAVVRNRVKRRLREIVRGAAVNPGTDVIFIARKGTEIADFQELQEAARNLLQRARLTGKRATVAASASPDAEGPP